MDNSTTLLDQILYHTQRPWLEENLLDIKFAPKLSEIQEIVPEFPMHYKIEFQRPFDSKTKYYQRLIQNSVVKDVSDILSHMREHDDESITYYLLNDLLDKKLTTRLKYVGELLHDKDYSLTYLGRNYIPSVEEKPHQTNTFIMQLLKLAYMQVYLEIQEEYKKFRNDILIPEDFYLQLLHEPIPEKIPLAKSIIINTEPVVEKKSFNTPKKEASEGLSFTYKKFAQSPQNINNLWNNFKLNKWIPEDTSLATFRKLFSGKKIENPVRWLGNISELFYFVKLIYTVFELVERVGQRNWEITCNCFIDANGEKFDRSIFRNQKIPQTTKHKIEKAVDLLK